jgi:hypothetical protein
VGPQIAVGYLARNSDIIDGCGLGLRILTQDLRLPRGVEQNVSLGHTEVELQ